MRDEICLALIKRVVDSQKDLIIIFHNNEIVLVNRAFYNFFSVSSLEEYKTEFGLFVDNFVPHPHYFHKDKVKDGSSWFNAILKLPEMERVVSMMTPSYEPHAFSVHVDKIEEYVIGVFEDITQTLIKRIMIENNANIDKESGAYAKNYFLQVAQSYQDAVVFNEKIVSAILIKANKKDGSCVSSDGNILKALVSHFKSVIRQDDMLIRWSDNAFLLIYLVDNAKSAQMMLDKLYLISKEDEIKGIDYFFTLTIQEKNEKINAFLGRVEG